MNTLFILNDPPYGTERSYNALRLARSLLDQKSSDVRVFLMGDAAACAHGGQKVPQGYYNIGDMLGAVLRRGGDVGVCGTCMDARGITAELYQGRIAAMAQPPDGPCRRCSCEASWGSGHLGVDTLVRAVEPRVNRLKLFLTPGGLLTL
jgi:uncharacterized protein involved in oxidation of intracellular sulfur